MLRGSRTEQTSSRKSTLWRLAPAGEVHILRVAHDLATSGLSKQDLNIDFVER